MKGLLAKCTSLKLQLDDKKQELSLNKSKLAYLRESVELFPHQVSGVEFLMGLHGVGHCGGILADEMGLGKTLQTLVFIAWLKQFGGGNPPFLVVCPLTLCDNWAEETKKFTTLSVVAYKGSAAERQTLRDGLSRDKLPPDVVVVSYEFALRNELAFLSWGYMVVDEGHRLKNPEAQLYKALSLEGCEKTLLTGTPVQNNLAELFALLSFVNPSVFSNASEVLSEIDVDWKRAVIGNASEENEQLSDLHDALRPFLLRRRKEDTNVLIPPKCDLVLYVGMTAMQRHYYKLALSKNIHAIVSGGSGVTGSTGLNNVLCNLRKCTNHPYLFDGAEPKFDGEWRIGDHIFTNSAKLHALNTLLEKLWREKHKVLLFCTMTRVLDIIQDYMEMKGWHYERLDGSVRAEERSLAVNAFQDDGSDAFCFLLSTRAGGQGLNLTAASYVIFYDQDFNPQVDLQAQARAHRIGQTKPVTIIRLIVKHSVEEILYRRSRSKLFISQAVVEQGRHAVEQDQDSDHIFSKKDLLEVIQFGVANLDQAGDEPPALREEDVSAMIEDAWAKQSKLPGPSHLKRAKTIVRVQDGGQDEGEENNDMYMWNGVDQRDADYVAALVKADESATNAASGASAAGGRRSLESKRVVSEAEKVRRQLQKRRKLEELWQENGYRSLKLASLEEEEDPASEFDSDFDFGQLKELNYVNGDTAAASFGNSDRPKIIVIVTNVSGDWPARGLFRSITENHGKEISLAYERCVSNKDCALGDVHLVPSSTVANQFVALVVSMSGTKMRSVAFESGLRALSRKAMDMKASVHVSRISGDGLAWYAAERHLRTIFKHVECFVYYFSPQLSAASRNTTGLPSRLPSHLRGHVFYFDLGEVEQRNQLFRMAITCGAEVAYSQNDPSVTHHVKEDKHAAQEASPMNDAIVWSIQEFVVHVLNDK